MEIHYITHNVVAMTSPPDEHEINWAECIVAVATAFEDMLHKKFRLYNLSERQYNRSGRFKENILGFSFPDHHAPPLPLLFDCVHSMLEWLESDTANVVVVHCMGGRSRLATVISAYLFEAGLFATTSKALSHFLISTQSNPNSPPGSPSTSSPVLRSVNQPSQLRYLDYFSKSLTSSTPPMNVKVKLGDAIVSFAPHAKLQLEIYSYKDSNHKSPLLNRSDIFSSDEAGQIINPSDQVILHIDREMSGDLLLRIVEKKKPLGHALIHTSFVGNDITFQKSDFDMLSRDRRFSDKFSIRLTLVHLKDDPANVITPHWASILRSFQDPRPSDAEDPEANRPRSEILSEKVKSAMPSLRGNMDLPPETPPPKPPRVKSLGTTILPDIFNLKGRQSSVESLTELQDQIEKSKRNSKPVGAMTARTWRKKAGKFTSPDDISSYYDNKKSLTLRGTSSHGNAVMSRSADDLSYMSPPKMSPTVASVLSNFPGVNDLTPPTERSQGNEILLEGYLETLSRFNKKKLRWFVLKSHRIFQYESKGGMLKRTLHLRPNFAIEEVPKFQFAFRITTPNQKEWTMVYENSKEKEKWISALQNFCKDFLVETVIPDKKSQRKSSFQVESQLELYVPTSSGSGSSTPISTGNFTENSPSTRSSGTLSKAEKAKLATELEDLKKNLQEELLKNIALKRQAIEADDFEAAGMYHAKVKEIQPLLMEYSNIKHEELLQIETEREIIRNQIEELNFMKRSAVQDEKYEDAILIRKKIEDLTFKLNVMFPGVSQATTSASNLFSSSGSEGRDQILPSGMIGGFGN
eukprot:TRINITY_DN2578_c0_g1_i2.p1 TRINITY_DN2578_c0_g1~~TRINITY_DN2578_c0_g1_i2.p1  ORF type:complete len:807 (-),score=264.02 TRINITY_DN2578_c0_g1_i2:81-2501(-)